MKVACQSCGAPLEVERGNAFAQCTYCGHANKVKSAQTLMAEQPRPTPPPVMAPVPVRPPVVRAPGVGRPKGRSFSIAGCFPVLLVLGGLSFAGYNVLNTSGLWDRLTTFVSAETSEPTLGTVDLDQPAGAPLRGITTGERDARSLGGDCRGYIPHAPHVRLRTATDGIVQLDVADSTVDLVMAVHRADGTWQCDDDGGQGTLPRLQIQLTAGEHLVYVGTFSQSGTSAFSLRTTWQSVDAPVLAEGIAPDATPSLGQAAVSLERGSTQVWNGTSSGAVEARTLSTRCRGAVPVVPHLHIRASGGEAIQLQTVDASTDLTMVVRTPSGQFLCDDDSGDGLNPAVNTVLEAGTTAVWIGVFSAHDSAEFTLEMLSEAGPGLHPGVPPRLGEVNLDIAPTPAPMRGELRAELDAQTLDPACRGWIGHGPDLSLVTTIPRTFNLTAQSRADVTLIVREPDGRLHCDDNSGEGRTPLITETLTPGVTEVWVGGTRRRGPREFTLSVTHTL